MVAPSKILELLPDGYGYVMFTFVDSVFVNMWLAKNVMKARKEYNVQVYTSAFSYILSTN